MTNQRIIQPPALLSGEEIIDQVDNISIQMGFVPSAGPTQASGSVLGSGMITLTNLRLIFSWIADEKQQIHQHYSSTAILGFSEHPPKTYKDMFGGGVYPYKAVAMLPAGLVFQINSSYDFPNNLERDTAIGNCVSRLLAQTLVVLSPSRDDDGALVAIRHAEAEAKRRRDD